MKKGTRVFRLLIVEDDADRIGAIRSWLPEDTRCVVASSTGRALGILERDRGQVYAGILLDHDLQKQALTDADRALSASDLVEVIVRNVSNETAILIHSMNVSQAPAMALRLEKAGFWITRIPMRELSKKRLRDWLREVREVWEDL